ncbi:hypothetical protein MCG44_00885 [Lawsonibacter sp. OA9]|uniref:hypothetical protein n=1 Tax=Oscillospiraceae TaxID=216572 RepID=UPI001F06CCA2|nr:MULTISPECIES: hypothetical protein [Oscillospiraceae]MCH1978308.1 hypothetical protein [Lawsonibacter sp. OA9]MCH1983799.1 hypothetical protein [Ruminococcus sp. OA3]
MKHREFAYTGKPVPKLDDPKYAAFLTEIQKAVFWSLEKRKLLTPEQREHCLEELESRHCRQCIENQNNRL